MNQRFNLRGMVKVKKVQVRMPSKYRGVEKIKMRRPKRKMNEIERCANLKQKQQYQLLIEQFRKQAENSYQDSSISFTHGKRPRLMSFQTSIVDLCDDNNEILVKSEVKKVTSKKEEVISTPKNFNQALVATSSRGKMISGVMTPSGSKTEKSLVKATSSSLDKTKTKSVTKAYVAESKENIIEDHTPAVTTQSYIDSILQGYKRREALRKKEVAEQRSKAEEWAKKYEQKQDELSKSLHAKLKLHEISLDEEDEEGEMLRDLTEDEEDRVDEALISSPGHALLVECFNIRMTRQLINALQGTCWLNDEIINYYMEMIRERSSKNEKLPKAHCMNTFFYPKLSTQGYRSVRRWTKKVDIFTKDVIFYPIHLGIHWTLAVIDFRKKGISYYDSMGGGNRSCLNTLKSYLEQEHLDKKKQSYDTSDWKLTNMTKKVPQQLNGSDCGVFTCMFAEFLSRNAKLEFSQEHMPLCRRTMVLEILNSELDR